MKAFMKFSGVVVLLALTAFFGCADHSESYHREVVDSTPTAAASPAGQTVVVEKHVEHTDRSPHGVFDIVGEILAFPFQLIADVFRFVF